MLFLQMVTVRTYNDVLTPRESETQAQACLVVQNILPSTSWDKLWNDDGRCVIMFGCIAAD